MAITKKQREELTVATAKWAFEDLGNLSVMENIRKDWISVLGKDKGSVLSTDFIKWCVDVMDVLGVGTCREIAEQQRVRSANIILRSFSGAEDYSVMAALGDSIAVDVLADTFTGREQLSELVS